MQQDMTHERTELWMCFSLDYDVFVQLSQKQLLSSIHGDKQWCGFVFLRLMRKHLTTAPILLSKSAKKIEKTWINISQLKLQQDCCLLVAFIVD